MKQQFKNSTDHMNHLHQSISDNNSTKKTQIKGWRGDTLSLEDYLTKEDIHLCKIELKIKDVAPEIASRILDAIKPYFENPYHQTELELDNKDSNLLDINKIMKETAK